MLAIYIIVGSCFRYVFRVFFKDVVKVNAPKKIFNQTIFVTNHASSIMDPLVFSVFQNPIVYYLTRGDLFKPGISWFLKACYMVPIYRAQDGEGTKEKNKQTFFECYKMLKKKKALLIFGEGYSDDVFVRRIKPIKKGAARIALGAMDEYNWEQDITIVCSGINYEDPRKMRSNILISNSDKIAVIDYKERYLKDAEGTIDELTQDIESTLKKQVTHVENIELCTMHEQMMEVSGKGMSPQRNGSNLIERFAYSQKLANKINSIKENDENLLKLKKRLTKYFRVIKGVGLDQKFVQEIAEKGRLSTFKNWLHVLFGWPMFLLGCLHMGIPYGMTKKFAEYKVKRPNFLSSVKTLTGMVIGGIYNILFIYAFYFMIYPSYWLAFSYFVIAPGVFFIYAYYYRQLFTDLTKKMKIKKMNTDVFVQRYNELQIEIANFVNAK